MKLVGRCQKNGCGRPIHLDVAPALNKLFSFFRQDTLDPSPLEYPFEFLQLLTGLAANLIKQMDTGDHSASVSAGPTPFQDLCNIWVCQRTPQDGGVSTLLCFCKKQHLGEFIKQNTTPPVTPYIASAVEPREFQLSNGDRLSGFINWGDAIEDYTRIQKRANVLHKKAPQEFLRPFTEQKLFPERFVRERGYSPVFGVPPIPSAPQPMPAAAAATRPLSLRSAMPPGSTELVPLAGFSDQLGELPPAPPPRGDGYAAPVPVGGGRGSPIYAVPGARQDDTPLLNAGEQGYQRADAPAPHYERPLRAQHHGTGPNADGYYALGAQPESQWRRGQYIVKIIFILFLGVWFILTLTSSVGPHLVWWAKRHLEDCVLPPQNNGTDYAVIPYIFPVDTRPVAAFCKDVTALVPVVRSVIGSNITCFGQLLMGVELSSVQANTTVMLQQVCQMMECSVFNGTNVQHLYRAGLWGAIKFSDVLAILESALTHATASLRRR